MVTRPHFQRLVDRVRNFSPLPAAIVFPCDRDALQMALSAQFAGYVAPILVGPDRRIAEAAALAGLDLSRIDIVDTPDDPFVAAQRAAALARNGEVRALVKRLVSRSTSARTSRWRGVNEKSMANPPGTQETKASTRAEQA